MIRGYCFVLFSMSNTPTYWLTGTALDNVLLSPSRKIYLIRKERKGAKRLDHFNLPSRSAA